MTRTVNRPPTQVHVPSDKQLGEKFFNHYNWKGICDDKNFLEVDQETFAYTKNVYVDSESRLRSRPAVKFESKIQGLASNCRLIKSWTFNDVVFEQYIVIATTQTRLVFRKNSPINGAILATDVVAYSDKVFKPILVDNCIFIFSDTIIYKYSIADNTIEKSNDAAVYIPNTKVISADNQETKLESKNVLTEQEIYTYLYNKTTGYSIDVVGKQVSVTIDGETYNITFDEYTPLVLTSKVNQFNSNLYVFVSDLNGIGLFNTSNNDLYFSVDGGKTFEYLDRLPSTPCFMPKFSSDGYYISCVTLGLNNEIDGIYIISTLRDYADGSLKKIYPTFTNVLNTLPAEFKSRIMGAEFADVNFVTYNFFGGFSRTLNAQLTTFSHNDFIVDCTDTANPIYIWSTDLSLNALPSNYARSNINSITCDVYKIDKDYYVSFIMTLSLANTPYLIVAARTINSNNLQYLLPGSTVAHIEDFTEICTYNNSTVTDYGAVSVRHSNVENYQYFAYNYKVTSGNTTVEECAIYKLNCDDVPSLLNYVNRFSLGEITDTYKRPSFISIDCNMVFASSGMIHRLSDGYIIPTFVGVDLGKIVPVGYANDIYYKIVITDNQSETINLYTTYFNNTFELQYVNGSGYDVFIPHCDSQLSDVYLSKNNELYISERRLKDGKFMWYLPEVNKQVMNYPITALHPISNVEMAIFNDREIWRVSYDTNLNGYTYTKSKLQVGVQQGSDVITTYDGTTVLFVCERGVVALNYQDFIASTEQKLTYISDTIYGLFKSWNVGPVKIYAYDFWILFYKTTSKDCWLYDIRNNSWWYLENFVNNEQWVTAVILEAGNKRYVPRLICGDGLYKLHLADTEYYDVNVNHNAKYIEWNVLSQKLYLSAINYFKHIINVTLNTAVDELNPVIMNYKMDIINYRHDANIGVNNEIFSFSVDTIRTFVKRTNYMKVLEFQYALKSNENVQFINQRPLSLCAVTVRYKITGKVR